MKKSILTNMLVAVMLLSLCSCVYMDVNTAIRPDGSGTVTAVVGFREDIYMAIDQGAEDMHRFTRDGVTYIGDEEVLTFNDLEEMNDIFDGSVHLTKTGEASFFMTFTYDNVEMRDTVEDMYPDYIDDAMLEGMYMSYMFEFPYAVQMVGAPHDGVYVEGKTVKIVISELPMTSSGTINFSIGNGAVAIFKDIKETDWFYAPINAMISAGYVNGYPDGSFGPNNTLSLAEMCQILAKTMSLETGTDQSGYWAGKAIQSCLHAGYINGHEDYSVPATREEAVAAMSRVYRDFLSYDYENTARNDYVIPDYQNISTQYLSDVVLSYDLGLCHGVDSTGTFKPKGNLTRAEFCQLYYNAGLSTN